MIRIGIVGTGALASLFAAYLHEVAHVVMVGSWAAQLEALATNGLLFIDLNGQERRCAVTATANAAVAAPVDVALILVKSYQTETAVSRLTSMLSPTGLAVTLQNGLGNLEQLAAAVGPQRAALGVVTMGATLLQPGVVRHAGAGVVYLSPPTAAHTAFAPLVAVLQQAGLTVQVVADARSLIWNRSECGYQFVNGRLSFKQWTVDRASGAALDDGKGRRIRS
ncbi:MAG: 2-dehydropantoate 2-reductase N-terminal domain-containing protein [Chloroflexota bacterium]